MKRRMTPWVVTNKLGRGLIFLSCCWCLGCGGARVPNQKPTFPVTGEIRVDGEIPSPPVQILCHPLEDDTEGEVLPHCTSKPDGTFRFGTYSAEDGVPAGDYVVLVTWRELDAKARKLKKADKLDGKYFDPKKECFEFSVEGKAVDLGLIEITTK